jgi:hypothetical protein
VLRTCAFGECKFAEHDCSWQMPSATLSNMHTTSSRQRNCAHTQILLPMYIGHAVHCYCCLFHSPQNTLLALLRVVWFRACPANTLAVYHFLLVTICSIIAWPNVVGHIFVMVLSCESCTSGAFLAMPAGFVFLCYLCPACARHKVRT